MPFLFNKNKKYKFSAEQYKKEIERFNLKQGTWHLKCDNKEVMVKDRFNGEIDRFTIVPQWCVEIGNFKYKIGETVVWNRQNTYYIKQIEDRVSKRTWYGKRINYYLIKFAFGYEEVKESKLRKYKSE